MHRLVAIITITLFRAGYRAPIKYINIKILKAQVGTIKITVQPGLKQNNYMRTTNNKRMFQFVDFGYLLNILEVAASFFHDIDDSHQFKNCCTYIYVLGFCIFLTIILSFFYFFIDRFDIITLSLR